MRDAVRHFVSEFIGTFALVFVGGLSLMMANGTGAQAGVALIIAALAHGLILAVMITALIHVSGHFNPAVTLGFVVARRISGAMAGIYVAAQLIGGIVAAYVLKLTVPMAAFAATRGGGQVISLSITGGQAIALEGIAAFFLVWVVFGSAVDPKAPRVGGLAIGLTLTACILAIGPLTGASLNPARSLGPAIATGIFEGQFVYWVGPLLGGAVAGLLYDQLFLRRGAEPVDHGAVEPV